MRITIITSISGTRLISSGSFSLPRWKFTASVPPLGALRRHRVVGPFAVQDVDQLGSLLLHLHNQRVDLVAEVAVEDQRRHGDADAEGGVVERDRDAVRELLRVGAGRRLRAEDLDHADHRAEQAEQRRGGGDGAERGQEALQIVRHGAARFLDRLLHDVTRGLVIAQPGGEHRAERRVLGELHQHLVGDALALVDRDHLVEQLRRDDLPVAQRHRALDDQGQRDDGSEEQEPDGPAGSLDDGEQRVPLSFLDVLRGDCTAKARGAASCAVQHQRADGSWRAAIGSGFCDIHKNLWISLWIVHVQTLLTQLIEDQSRLRSKFEQCFPVREQGIREKNRLPRVNLSGFGIGPATVWISVGSPALLTAMQNDSPAPPQPPAPGVVTVSELLRSVRDSLERRFPLLWVSGEISNLSRAPSGHCYFTLKDGQAQVECVMFRSRAALLQRELENGARIEARARVTLYEPRGRCLL